MVAPPSTQGAAFHRGCSGRGRGGDLLFLAEREQPPPCPVCEAGRWSCLFASQGPRRNRRRRATRPRQQDCPGRECVPPRRDHSGTVPTGRGSKDVAPQRGWHSSQRPHLQKVGHGSPRNSIANTRPTETVVGALQSHVYLRHSATTCGLELAHVPLFANTHTLNCPLTVSAR